MANQSKDRDDSRPPAPTDPYLAFARATDFRYLPKGANWIPLLVELKEGVSVAAFAEQNWIISENLRSSISVPALYRNAPRGLEKTTVCTALLRKDDFEAVVATSEWSSVVERYGFGLPIARTAESATAAARPTAASAPRQRNDARPPSTPPIEGDLGRAQTSAQTSSETSYQTGVVVLGVIDDGLAFAHERFRSAGTQTRIKRLWNQEATAAPSLAVPYGRELTGTDIDQALAASLAAGVVDDDYVYHLLRHEDYRDDIHKAVGRRTAHGTSVMDHAAAIVDFFPTESRPIIAVQLSSEVTGDTSGAHLTTAALDGIWYILHRADELFPGDPPPAVVINLSYGMIAGPHDGSQGLEVAIDQIVNGRNQTGAKLAVVLPAGNDRLARCHALLKVASGQDNDLQWRALPDDRTPSSLEIWIAPNGNGVAPRIRVTVTDPSGSALPAIHEGETFPPGLLAAAPCSVDYSYPPSGSGARTVTVILLPSAPTEPLDPAEPVAPSGLWRINVAHDDPDSGSIEINAWIQRDDSPLGYPIFGRQSYFDPPDYVRFEDDGHVREFDPPAVASDVRRSTTLNAIATGATSFVIGGLRESDNTVAKYSSLGPPLPAARRIPPAPNVIARCDDSVACHGVIAAGTRSGSYVAMNGTSVAAPQVARWIADQFALGLPVNADTLAAATTGDADRVPPALRSAAQGDGVMGNIKSSRPIARSAPRPDFK